MTAPHSAAELEPTGSALAQIDQVLDEIAERARADVGPSQFYRFLLEGSVRALAATGGAVWTVGSDRRLRLECQVNLAQTGVLPDPDGKTFGPDGGAACRSHAELLDQAAGWREPRIFPPHSGGKEGSEANPTDLLLIVHAVRGEGQLHAVLEIFQRSDTSPAAQKGFVRFLAAVGELAVDYHRGRQLRRLQAAQADWSRLNRFAQRIHTSLDLDETAYTIANEGRRVIGCDRLAVVLRRGSKCKLLAVSGADDIDRRAVAVRGLEALSAAVLATGEPLWYGDQETDLPPQIEAALDEYLDQTHVRLLGILPLCAPAGETEETEEAADAEPDEPIGALVVERFDNPGDEALRARTKAVAEPSWLALRNALEFRSIPLARLLAKARWLRRARRLPKLAVAAGVLAAAIVAAALVPADFEIEAAGALQPRVQREVFAPSDGVVYRLAADHGHHIEADQVVAELRRPDLDLEFHRVWGELQTVRKKLAAAQAARIDTSLAVADGPDRYQRLTAEEEELKEQLKGLEAQREVLGKQMDELRVRSPIAGQVLTWNVQQLLDARPVQRGQTLMTVADLDGPWVLELRVADRRAGHVLAAQRQLRPDLDVSFILSTDPRVRHLGKIEKAALSTDPEASDGPSMALTVEIDREQIEPLRPGATITAKIHCGRRPIGYVWLHELWEAIQARVLF